MIYTELEDIRYEIQEHQREERDASKHRKNPTIYPETIEEHIEHST